MKFMTPYAFMCLGIGFTSSALISPLITRVDNVVGIPFAIMFFAIAIYLKINELKISGVRIE